MKLNRIAHIDEKDIPDPKTLALYVKVLKMHLKDNKLDANKTKLINNLPNPKEITESLSWEECKILFETINYLWKRIIHKDILEENSIEKSEQKLLGNYWLLENGILLSGINHTSIILQNTALISTLLNINGFTLQYYLSVQPNKLLKFIIASGGVRMFINKNNKGWFQMTGTTYGSWARNKVKKYDLKKKTVKVIDLKANYDDWKSGISIIL